MRYGVKTMIMHLKLYHVSLVKPFLIAGVPRLQLCLGGGLSAPNSSKPSYTSVSPWQIELPSVTQFLDAASHQNPHSFSAGSLRHGL